MEWKELEERLERADGVVQKILARVEVLEMQMRKTMDLVESLSQAKEDTSTQTETNDAVEETPEIKKRQNTTFAMLGIKNGETVVFAENSNIVGEVSNGKYIITPGGVEASIQRATVIARELAGLSAQVRPSALTHWLYKGKSLQKWREELDVSLGVKPVKSGRRPLLTEQQMEEAAQMRGQGYQYKAIAECYGVSAAYMRNKIMERGGLL